MDYVITLFSNSVCAQFSILASVLIVVASCTSGGGSSQDNAASQETLESFETSSVAADTANDADNNDLTISDAQSELNDANEIIDTGDLLPVLFSTQTDLDLDYARSGVDIIERINTALILPNDIDVIFADCVTANAFYVSPFAPISDIEPEDNFQVSSGGAIFKCHELTELFSNFFSDKDQAVGASLFVLMHELGHALVNQLQLPVLGIEESYVDGMAAVFLGEAGLSEGSVLAGWFFGNQGQTPFYDTHRAGPQRLGDLACWGIGADISLTDDPLISSIAEQLMSGGRNCQFEYDQQRRALITVQGPHIRGNLSDILDNTSTMF